MIAQGKRERFMLLVQWGAILMIARGKMLLQIIQKFIVDLPSQFQLQDKHEQDCQSMFEDAMPDLLEINYHTTAIDDEIRSALNIQLGI